MSTLKNLRRLNACMKIFGDVFYTVGVDSTNVRLQGWYKSDTIIKAMQYKFDVAADKTNGYIHLTRDVYRITLT